MLCFIWCWTLLIERSSPHHQSIVQILQCLAQSFHPAQVVSPTIQARATSTTLERFPPHYLSTLHAYIYQQIQATCPTLHPPVLPSTRSNTQYCPHHKKHSIYRMPCTLSLRMGFPSSSYPNYFWRCIVHGKRPDRS